MARVGGKRAFPLWQTTVFFFGGLLLVVNILFFWHTRRTEELFLRHAREDALLVARMVRLASEVGYLSEAVLRETLAHFLRNTASFLDYLELAEPFSHEELSAFAEENHLFGLVLRRFSGEEVIVPEGWFHSELKEKLSTRNLLYYAPLDIFVFRTENLKSCAEIVVATRVEGLKGLHERISLGGLFERLRSFPMIVYVREVQGRLLQPEVRVDSGVIEVRVPFREESLLVGLSAEALEATERHFQMEYFFLSGVLVGVGVFLSLLFYRVQKTYLEHLREYERALSREREEASLGRAAAAIAHEIKNPLNTVSMALQRVLLEGNLSPEHRRLLNLVMDSVKRANGTLKGLLDYARMPRKIAKKIVSLDRVVEDLLTLIEPELAARGVRFERDTVPVEIPGNEELLYRMVENVLRNALEAVEPGGLLRVFLGRKGRFAMLRLENTGDLPPEEALSRIFEPYVTFKTRGTGLGLAVVRKIVLAHGGWVSAALKDGLFVLEIRLPLEEKE